MASLIFLLCRNLGAAARDSILAALAYTFGTIAFVYGRTFFAEPLLALISILGFYVMFKAEGPSKGAWLSLLAALAVLATS